MKVTKYTPFQPITIQLETQEDLDMVLSLLDCARRALVGLTGAAARQPRLGCANRLIKELTP